MSGRKVEAWHDRGCAMIGQPHPERGLSMHRRTRFYRGGSVAGVWWDCCGGPVFMRHPPMHPIDAAIVVEREHSMTLANFSPHYVHVEDPRLRWDEIGDRRVRQHVLDEFERIFAGHRSDPEFEYKLQELIERTDEHIEELA